MNIDRLKELRKYYNLNQEEVAKILKIQQQNYSRYELGNVAIPIEKLEILANYYGTSIDYLIGRTDVKEPYPETNSKSR